MFVHRDLPAKQVVLVSQKSTISVEISNRCYNFPRGHSYLVGLARLTRMIHLVSSYHGFDKHPK